ncbi:MAG: deoxyribonuclease IV [Thermodesulfobacteriota bacterium]
MKLDRNTGNDESGGVNRRCLLGAHLSIAEGLSEALYRAKKYNCTALQIFTKNAVTWKERNISEEEIHAFDKARSETGIVQIASHAAYLLNIASEDKKKRRISIHGLAQELIRSARLEIPYVVLHPGSHMGSGEEAGIRNVADGVNDVLKETDPSTPRLLLETTAGQGSGIGYAFGQLADMLSRINTPNRVGICLDTSHIFAAGYDIRTQEAYDRTMEHFSDVIGFDRLYLIHLNDAKKELGSRVDRHEHIGKGFIGLEGFALVMNDPRFCMIPKIIETPKGGADIDFDRINLDRLIGLLRS